MCHTFPGQIRPGKKTTIQVYLYKRSKHDNIYMYHIILSPHVMNYNNRTFKHIKRTFTLHHVYLNKQFICINISDMLRSPSIQIIGTEDIFLKRI